MAIQQLTVFVENKRGALAEITDALARNQIDMRALSIADTKNFGILRLIVNDNALALKVLGDLGCIVKETEVIGVKINDQPGKLNQALQVLDEGGVNVEYLYAFLTRTERHAYVILRVADNVAAGDLLEAAGFHLVTESDILKL